MLLDHYLDGAYYPKGGSAALRDAFVTALQEKKVALKNRTPVTCIKRSGSEFIVEVQSGECFSARTVISNVDPAIAFRQIIDPTLIPRATQKKVARMKPSVGSIYAFIGTSRDPATTGMTDANIIHYDHTDVNQTFNAVNQRATLAPFPYFFITSPSCKDPSQHNGTQSGHTIEILSGLGNQHPFSAWSGTPSRKRGKDYLTLKNQIGMCLVKSAERYLPDLSQHLDYVEFATPLSNEYWVNSYQGGNFGPEQSPKQFGPGRFFDCTTGIKGLFIVGAGAISAGVLSCIASGVWAANQAVEFLR
jgi:all-trans-retinol 13,14-reductase